MTELEAYRNYLARTGNAPAPIAAALIDMDGVLYDSMTNHSKAWKRLSDEEGWTYDENEFFLYEGMTGAAIIRLIAKRNGKGDVSDEEAKRLYAKKRNTSSISELSTKSTELPTCSAYCAMQESNAY